VLFFPIAGLLHDHELVRFYGKAEHPFWFWLKVVVYALFTCLITVSWIMQDIQISAIGNYALIIVPIYCMGYSHYLFSKKYGVLSQSNTVHN
jgi:hypothetical protein